MSIITSLKQLTGISKMKQANVKSFVALVAPLAFNSCVIGLFESSELYLCQSWVSSIYVGYAAKNNSPSNRKWVATNYILLFDWICFKKCYCCCFTILYKEFSNYSW